MTTEEIIKELEDIQNILNSARYKNPDNIIPKKQVSEKMRNLIEKAKLSAQQKRGSVEQRNEDC